MINITSDDSEDFDVETMRKELLGSDPSDRAMRVKIPVKYIVSDEDNFEILSQEQCSC